MLPAERRRQGISRITRLHEPESIEMDPFVNRTAQERMEALWDLTLEYLTWTHPNERESRLQRSVCRIERRAR
jgi:hypothetical protein